MSILVVEMFNKMKKLGQNIKEKFGVKSSEPSEGVFTIQDEGDSHNSPPSFHFTPHKISLPASGPLHQRASFTTAHEKCLFDSSIPGHGPAIVCLVVVDFHHLKGPSIDFLAAPPLKRESEEVFGLSEENCEEIVSRCNSLNSQARTYLPIYPDLDVWRDRDLSTGPDMLKDELLNALLWVPMLALPDGVHTSKEPDAVYFAIPTSRKTASFGETASELLFGVSVFYGICSEELENVPEDCRRGHIQKAVVVLSRLPFFGTIHHRMDLCVLAYCRQKNVADHSLLVSMLQQMRVSVQWEKLGPAELVRSIDIVPMLRKLKLRYFSVLKCILAESRIIVYSENARAASSAVLGFLVGLPLGSLLLGFNSAGLGRYHYRLKKYGLPLKLFGSDYPVLPFLSLELLNVVQSASRGYLVGTSNRLLIDSKSSPLPPADVVVNMDRAVVTFGSRYDVEKVANLTSSERRFMQTSVLSHAAVRSYRSQKRRKVVTGSYLREELPERVHSGRRKKKKDFELVSLSPAILTLSDQEDIFSKSDQEEGHLSDSLELTSADFDVCGVISLFHIYWEQWLEQVLKGTAVNCPFLARFSNTKSYAVWQRSHRLTQEAEEGKYYGEHINGKKEGRGIFVSSGGHIRYEGEWAGDLKHGWGELSCERDGYIYDGQWRHDRKEGEGRMISRSEKYCGQFANDVYHGNGIWMDAVGSQYDGEFKGGLREGMGREVKAKTGLVYVGEWKQGVKSGNGQLRSCEGERMFVGEFRDGFRHGLGKQMWHVRLVTEDGEVSIGHLVEVEYEGQWASGRRNGQGTLSCITPDCRLYGVSVEGEWRDSQIVTEDGAARLVLLGGIKYSGGLDSKGRASGHGVAKDATSGYVYDGQWKDGRPICFLEGDEGKRKARKSCDWLVTPEGQTELKDSKEARERLKSIGLCEVVVPQEMYSLTDGVADGEDSKIFAGGPLVEELEGSGFYSDDDGDGRPLPESSVQEAKHCQVFALDDTGPGEQERTNEKRGVEEDEDRGRKEGRDVAEDEERGREEGRDVAEDEDRGRKEGRDVAEDEERGREEGRDVAEDEERGREEGRDVAEDEERGREEGIDVAED